MPRPFQPQTHQPTAQPVMMAPPAVITTKDLSYLKDAMSWELLAAKKCFHFANECTDAKVASAIQRAGQMHTQHYQKLLAHCQPGHPTPGPQ
ncbi:hypothetical protein [Alicyclobacillus shizuokensis]|uniref:hypothetical protein n=1 Tax=Alicyclobacillus shizuokensis TaxID=392014 RepID=UPI00082DC5CB|nr:hypothetical protein [Alicyclobacillus shizuokensis]MCL6626642.1 hypothetical protein [Alicyclobacillus shizuokensis]